MKTCADCRGKVVQKVGKTPESVAYKYYRCNKCGEELLDMKQLHAVAEEYRTMKTYRVKLTRWGLSLGLRIPKELAAKYHFGEEVSIIPEKKGLLVIP